MPTEKLLTNKIISIRDFLNDVLNCIYIKKEIE